MNRRTFLKWFGAGAVVSVATARDLLKEPEEKPLNVEELKDGMSGGIFVYVICDEDIPSGSLVVANGSDSIKTCKKGQQPIGVATHGGYSGRTVRIKLA